MVNSEWSDPFGTMLDLICGAAGVEGRWLIGCFCHVDQYLADDTYQKRRAKMRLADETYDGLCPWKGKKAAAMALGYWRKICQHLRDATSQNFQAILLIISDRDESHDAN